MVTLLWLIAVAAAGGVGGVCEAAGGVEVASSKPLASMLTHTVHLWTIQNLFQRATFLAEVSTLDMM